MSPYQAFIQSLSDDDLSALLDGKLSIGCDASAYRLQAQGVAPFDGINGATHTRDGLLALEESVLVRLFSQRPLCREEFDYQAAVLLSAHGAERFLRRECQQGHWALMIDVWRLIAVGPEDVRSQYGYFCNVEGPLNDVEAESHVMRWLKSGEAYDDYRSKTHCRYCQ